MGGGGALHTCMHVSVCVGGGSHKVSGRAPNGCDPLKLYYGLLRCQYPSLHLNSDPINPKLSVMILDQKGGVGGAD